MPSRTLLFRQLFSRLIVAVTSALMACSGHGGFMSSSFSYSEWVAALDGHVNAQIGP
jgi:hypothetical protein